MENRIIASTYQVIREIGSGGGGVVYLATHLRLGKFVVLKADKRGLTQKPEALRREVDALKNLSHTYIPQVYDFIEENGVVYTVMDYVEGESLDKPLKRGSAFPQATVVQWACQLLEALNYMHTRPPHGILHGDIKPANIMLTPQGDIRLIDFNIALALGEKGAVRVGFSQGYASPEHYGIDYAGIAQTQRMAGVETVVTAQAETVVTGNVTFVPPTDGSHKSSRSAEASLSTLLDVRSDIYSLGATLYHLLTGMRPAREAAKVIPISDFNISPAVAAIIEKAMQPCPDDRYQTAAEMLDAFEHLYENDPRTLHYKKAVRITLNSFHIIPFYWVVWSLFSIKDLKEFRNGFFFCPAISFSCRALGGYFSRTPIKAFKTKTGIEYICRGSLPIDFKSKSSRDILGRYSRSPRGRRSCWNRSKDCRGAYGHPCYYFPKCCTAQSGRNRFAGRSNCVTRKARQKR